MIAAEMQALAGRQQQISFPQGLQLNGAWTVASIRAGLDRLLADDSVDVIIALGPIASHISGRRSSLARPVVASEIIDATIQRLPRRGRGSGRADLTYITNRLDLKREIEAFRSIVEFNQLAILVSPAHLEAMPELAAAVQAQAKRLGVPTVILPVDAAPDAVVARIPNAVDAVYVAPQTQLDEAAYRKLAAALIERQLPSFATQGYPDVEWGMLATTAPPVDVSRYMRRIALAAHQIILGEPVSGLPVAFESGERLTINRQTARALNLSHSWKVLNQASFVGPLPVDLERKVTLVEVAQAALQRNLRLRAERESLRADAYAIERTSAPLLPKIDGSVAFRVIDADRARASFGQAPQYAGTGKLTLTQLVYNEGAWVNRDLQAKVQRSRVAGVQTSELDIVHDTAVAWFDVHRARTAVRVQRANLDLSRQNLNTAQIRARLGAGRSVDIHRWEAQIAQEQQSVIGAESNERMARMVLAELTGVDLEDRLAPVPVQLTDDAFLISRPAVLARLGTRRGFERFRDFMTEQAIKGAPELRQIDAALAAAEGRANLARRFWLPTIAVQAELEHRFLSAGDGKDISDAVTIDPTFAAMVPANAISIAAADVTNWFVGLNVSLPIFDGGERYTEIHEADARVIELRRQRDAASRQLEYRLRIAMHQAGAAFPRIELSARGAAAARKSLNAALDAYSRGVIDETRLLDAQNSALISDALAANALYDFLVRLMGVHRAVGTFYFMKSASEKAAFEQRFLRFMQSEGSPPRGRPPPLLPAPEAP